MRTTDDGLEIDVLWTAGVSVENVDSTIATIDDREKELWETPQTFYNPKNIGPKLLKEALDKEYDKVVEFKAFEWAPTAACIDCKWITSRWEDRIKPDGAVRARWVLREFANDDRDNKFFSCAPTGAATALTHIYALRRGHEVRYIGVATAFMHSTRRPQRATRGRATAGS